MNIRSILASVFMAVTISGISFVLPTSAVLAGGEHSCDKMASVMCNLCGSGSTACKDAKEVASECKAQAQYCPVTACDPTLEAFKRVPKAYQKAACSED